MTASLLFDGTLELIDPDGSVSGGSYWFETLAEGASFGDPQPVEVGIASLLRDGALVEKTGDGNRESFWMIRVKAADQGALDDGVAALHCATGKRTTLVFTPPDGYGPARVWDVETSNLLEPNGFDDLAYMKRNQMVFRLRLVCQPFRRGTTEIIDDAGTPPSTGGTLLYNCESTTGWAGWTGAGSAVVDTVIFTEGAGSIRTQTTNISTGSYLATFYWLSYSSDQVTGLSLSTGTGGYLSLAVRIEYADVVASIPEQPGLEDLYVQIGGAWVAVTDFVATTRDVAGFVHYVWPVAAGLTITGLRMGVRQVKVDNSGSLSDGFAHNPYAWYDDVELLPAATTDHQIVKQLTVEGSARTTGSLRVSAPSESVALGQVLAITAPIGELPAGFQPDGRRWVTQGTTTTDAAALHGSYFTPDTATYSTAAGKPIFDVPVNMLTAGPYSMVALVKAETSSLEFGVQAQLRLSTSAVGPTSVAETSLTGLATGWQLVTVGTIYLPPLPMEGADDATSKVRLLFKGAKMADVFFIPAWQVGGQPVADFSIVDCGTGTVGPGLASSSLWFDSPSPANDGRGLLLRGPTVDRRNAQRVTKSEAKKPGTHTFRPGGLTAFLVSLGAAGPTLTLRYFDRYL